MESAGVKLPVNLFFKIILNLLKYRWYINFVYFVYEFTCIYVIFGTTFWNTMSNTVILIYYILMNELNLAGFQDTTLKICKLRFF